MSTAARLTIAALTCLTLLGLLGLWLLDRDGWWK